MSGIEEWYTQWNRQSKEIIDSLAKERNEKKEKIMTEILKDKRKYINPSYKKFARDETKSIVDISYIYDKVVDGIYSAKLMSKEPVINSGNTIYEYGFSDNGKCIYRRKKSKNSNTIDRLYVHQEHKIYELDIVYMEKNELSTIAFNIMGEYYFDQNNYPIKIIRNYGILNYEKYHWLDENIAIVDTGIKKYMVIKDKTKVVSIFQELQNNKDSELFSYNTQNYVKIDSKNIILENKISYGNTYIKYCYIKDITGKVTEYKIINIYDKNYLVSTEYMRPPQNFSYKKAKEVFQSEIIYFILNQIDLLEFKTKYINVQYFGFGFPITDILIGFDDVYCDDIHTMKEIKDFSFSYENSELISNMNIYINEMTYYNSIKKIMKFIKKHIEQKCDVKVLLIEIND